MDCSGRSRQHRYRRLVALLLILVTARIAAVDTATVEFDEARVVKGNRFTIQIRTSIPWGEEVIIDRPDLEGPMVWWAYPYARSWVASTESGETVRLVEVLASIRIDAAGFHTIGSFRIKAGDRIAVSERKEIIGLEPDEADLPYPVTTRWRSGPAQVWQNQAVPVVLEARNLASIALAEDVTLSTAPGGLLEDAPGLGGIITRPHGDEILYDIPVASWIWTQETPGESVFPGVAVTVAGLRRSSPSFPVEVRPLPEAALSSGAVGRFRTDVEIEEGPYRVGDIVSVRIRVEGEGNMNVLKPPVPELAGASLVGQGSSSSYLPGPLGYEGWRVERYDFQLERTGELHLSVPGWAWLEPQGDEGRIRRSSQKTEILLTEEALEGDSDDEITELLGKELFRYSTSVFHWKHRFWFLLALPGVILLLVMFLLRRPGGKGLAAMLVLPLLLSASSIDAELTAAAADAAALGVGGHWEAAGRAYDSLSEQLGEHPGLLHDRALVEVELGRPDTAVYMLRRALLLRPGSARITRSLEIVEDRLGLDDQIPVPLHWPPWTAFTLFLVGINIIFLAFTRLLFKTEARDVIISVVSILVLLAGLLFMGYTDSLWDRNTAVVRIDAKPLRKIPGPLATDWIQLPAGSAVSIVAEEENDVLVRTGYGLEGWLPQSSLIPVSEAVDGL